jgi:N-acetylmuramate 1-kinase
LILPESFKTLKIESVDKLTADASDRSFYRLKTDKNSYVLMKDKPFSKKKYPFYLSYLVFKDLEVKVPLINKLAEKEGYVLQEDLGNVLLNDLKNKDLLKTYVFKTIDSILNYQTKTFNIKRDVFPLNRSFTKEKFLEELYLFEKYFLDFSFDQKKTHDDFLKIVNEMMKQKFCFQHRDMHSRNIMLKKNDIFFIDFQDARMGPFPYDIASLLIDPYINFTKDEENKFLKYYYKKVNKFLNLDYEVFLDQYSYNYIQRGFKILGSFSFLAKEKNKKSYLKYIKPTIKKLRRHLIYRGKEKEFLNLIWKL